MSDKKFKLMCEAVLAIAVLSAAVYAKNYWLLLLWALV